MEIIKDIDYKNKDVYEATEDLIDSLVEQSYIIDDEEVMLLSVYNREKEKSKKQADELNNFILKQLESINKDPILLTQSLDKSNTEGR